MAVSDRDIFATAKLVIKRHGGSAAYYAATKGDEFLDKGDLDGAAVWRRILKAVEELQAMAPKGPVH